MIIFILMCSSYRDYQYDNELPVTGRFDTKTQENMHEFKCGDKGIGRYDNDEELEFRFKRALNDTKHNDKEDDFPDFVNGTKHKRELGASSEYYE